MSRIDRCTRCGGNIVTPAYPGDGAYPVGRMCDCDGRPEDHDVCPGCRRVHAPSVDCNGQRLT
jgi:hypothetical protein